MPSKTASLTANREDAVRRLILQTIASEELPVGAGTIHFELRRNRLNTSTATVGRHLRSLEEEGLLKKVGVEGRQITAKGRQVLASLSHDHSLRQHGEELLGALRAGGPSKEEALAILAARRPIEIEIARLAATNATTGQIERMEASLRRQREMMKGGRSPVEADIAFHEALGDASGNHYLKAVISLLRRHGGYSQIITRVRQQSGTPLSVEHEAILEAVKGRDPGAAMRAAGDHISKLSAEIERYWSRTASINAAR